MLYLIIYSFYKYLLDINREPGILLGMGTTRPRTVKLKAQSLMAGRETVSLGHLGKQRRSINPAPSTVFLGRVTLELSFKGLWGCSGSPYSGVLRRVISQLSGDYLALLQLND